MIFRHVRTCRDGVSWVEAELSRPLDDEDVRVLAEGSSQRRFDDFPRPYCWIERPDGVSVKAAVGGRALRLRVPEGVDEGPIRAWLVGALHRDP